MTGENHHRSVHSQRMSEKKSKLSTDYGTNIYSCSKKDVNEQHGLSRGWKNERLAVKRIKVTGQFADKLRAHVAYTSCYVRCNALVATTSPDVSVRVDITAVCKVRNASHTGCLKNHANIVNKIHRTVTRSFNYFTLSFLIMHHIVQ